MIMPGFYRGVETGATPAVKTRKFSQYQMSTQPPTVETRGENEIIILGLTRPVPMLFLLRGRETPAVETRTPNEETRR
jgi:hypothetical protein